MIRHTPEACLLVMDRRDLQNLLGLGSDDILALLHRAGCGESLPHTLAVNLVPSSSRIVALVVAQGEIESNAVVAEIASQIDAFIQQASRRVVTSVIQLAHCELRRRIESADVTGATDTQDQSLMHDLMLFAQACGFRDLDDALEQAHETH